MYDSNTYTNSIKSNKQIKLQVNKGDTLKREGRLLKSFTRMQRPITVAILQCSTVGVNVTLKKKKKEIHHLFNRVSNAALLKEKCLNEPKKKKKLYT
jgi:hypothetical protein